MSGLGVFFACLITAFVVFWFMESGTYRSLYEKFSISSTLISKPLSEDEIKNFKEYLTSVTPTESNTLLEDP